MWPGSLGTATMTPWRTRPQRWPFRGPFRDFESHVLVEWKNVCIHCTFHIHQKENMVSCRYPLKPISYISVHVISKGRKHGFHWFPLDVPWNQWYRCWSWSYCRSVKGHEVIFWCRFSLSMANAWRSGGLAIVEQCPEHPGGLDAVWWWWDDDDDDDDDGMMG